ncbi:MAG: protein-tyrosine-phosphatase [Bauldia sp.]|nr:protein-tyrosine-phosphatase [Bauldia sp.]
MTLPPISLLTVCGIADLEANLGRGVTHVLSILDPGAPDPEAFTPDPGRHRQTLYFDDAIHPEPNLRLPTGEDIAAILEFGRALSADPAPRAESHLLVHCHFGLSRSTAALAMMIAQANPGLGEDEVLRHLTDIRPRAWPNSLMIAFADEALGRHGRLSAALRRHYGRQLATQPGLVEVLTRLNRASEIESAIRI